MLEVVGDGGEVNLGGGFGETSPSHPPEPVASLPGAKDFPDPAADAVNELSCKGLELIGRYGLVAVG